MQAKAGVYLNFSGNTEQVFKFYKSVFKKEYSHEIKRFSELPPQSDAPPLPEHVKNMVMHVALPITDHVSLFGSDAPQEMGFEVKQGNNVYIFLELKTKEELERIYNELSEGGRIEMPLQSTFWGGYFGSFSDKFGIQWMLQYTPTSKQLMNLEKIVVTTTVQLPIQKVWEFYTLPEHITKWNFASEDWHCPSASNDLRVGGKYIARMESKDGKIGFDFEAIYDEIELYKKIFYKLGDQRKVEILFSEEGNATVVRISFDPEGTYSLEQQRAGWQAILDNFRKYCETKK